MACGASVVTTQATVMSEVAGDEAFLSPSGDSLALASAITRALAQNPDDRAARARRARARAELFTWDVCLEQHVVAYQMARGQ